MKQKRLRNVALATLLTSTVLLPSDNAYAFFGLDGKSTVKEQLAQIVLAKDQQASLQQMLQSASIGSELAKVFEQMMGLASVVEVVVEEEVPEEFVRDYDTMKPADYQHLSESRMEYWEEIDGEIKNYEAEIALDSDQLDTLSMALDIAENPPSDITATQAQIIGDTSRLEQQRRDAAQEILKNKRAEIRKQLEDGAVRQSLAVKRCVRTNVCG